jgi:hypothetical protein
MRSNYLLRVPPTRNRHAPYGRHCRPEKLEGLTKSSYFCTTSLAFSGGLHIRGYCAITRRVLNKKSWFVAPIYNKDNIETFQQLAGFGHRVKYPVVHRSLEEEEHNEDEEFLRMRGSSVDATLISWR